MKISEYENFHIIGMTAWVTGPGRTDQQLHCDWLPFPLPEDVIKDPREKCRCWSPLYIII